MDTTPTKVSNLFPLYVGSEIDLEHLPSPEDWAVLHAAKMPFHKQFVGHSGFAAPKDHPEYLVARRDRRMALNMIDTDNSAHFARVMMDAGLGFITEHVAQGIPTLVHCNQGFSRAPSLALLWLAEHDLEFGGLPLERAEALFVERYPNYTPKAGVRGYLAANWPANPRTSSAA